MDRPYSDKIITDDNMDEAREALEEELGMPGLEYDGFYEELPEGFQVQDSGKGFDEHCRPNHDSHMNVSAMNAGVYEMVQTGQLAYQFGNGFMVFNYVDCM